MKIKLQNVWGVHYVLPCCLLCFLACFAKAANGDGAGDGSGGGQNQPLMVEKVVPADGATGVSLNPEIKIGL